MNFEHHKWPVRDLLLAFDKGSLSRNNEYQRGASWDDNQKRALVDSLLRGYPLPALFLHMKSSTILGEVSKKYDIVDGQQRLLALSEFFKGNFELFKVDDKRFKIPASVRKLPAPWAGCRYSDLSPELKSRFDDTKLDVQMILLTEDEDQIRDLFIRLQSGKALSAQQVRDAWPGNIGPFVELLAGKLKKRPKVNLFERVDRRGTRVDDDESVDEYVDHRMTCGQLLLTFITRSRDPQTFRKISSREVDGLYHEFSDFDATGETARRFIEVLDVVDEVLERSLRPQESDGVASKRKNRFRKVDIISLFCFVQDVLSTPNQKLDSLGKQKLAEHFRTLKTDNTGKSTSGKTLETCYRAYRTSLPDDIQIRLDARRVFSDEQKHELKLLSDGLCGVCKKPVLGHEEAEADHYPIPHYLGGVTELSNARYVHTRCHPRLGRPVE